ncbi:hypothetical protein ILT44_25725 [Microvirga sp. BT689]|uniref:hypothetical protein n=1 Tax=Microvirga arvi TaxID=2778731 RepID=UPI0019519A95|nr:hypothetical protein [Microvirga arvi]MBM6583603.1 hypothetical protein [Microvirga arvi]
MNPPTMPSNPQPLMEKAGKTHPQADKPRHDTPKPKANRPRPQKQKELDRENPLRPLQPEGRADINTPTKFARPELMITPKKPKTHHGVSCNGKA